MSGNQDSGEAVRRWRREMTTLMGRAGTGAASGDTEAGLGLLLVGLTFDDVLLIPQYSEILPGDASVATRFSRNITLNRSRR
jgi:hypothetical protein